MSRAVLVIIHALVFMTGAAGLVYQVVWQRYLARLLGSDSTAVAMVLAVFLGGLSAGYWLCGRWTRRLENCFRGYRAVAVAGLMAVGAFMAWQPGFQEHRFAFGTFRMASATPYSFAGARTFYEEFGRERQVRFYKDGAAGTVAVIQTAGPQSPPGQPAPPFGFPGAAGPVVGTNGAELAIVVNGKSDSHVRIDAETLKLTAHLPALWAPNRARVMIVGLGTGVTAAEMALYPEVESSGAASDGGVTRTRFGGRFGGRDRRTPRRVGYFRWPHEAKSPPKAPRTLADAIAGSRLPRQGVGWFARDRPSGEAPANRQGFGAVVRSTG